MEDQIRAYQRPGWVSSAFIVINIILWFFILAQFIGVLFALPFIDGNILDFLTKMAKPNEHPEVKVPLLIIQACATFFGLAFGPSLYWWVYEKRNPLDLLKGRKFSPVILLLTALIVLSFMVTNSVFIEWNANVRFPDFLKDFEILAKKVEALDEELAKFFTTFDSFGQFIVAFLLISVLAGFCEELVFRGMLQPQLYRATHNIHWAIWISAFLFSALHLQFFGFLPRMLLGALFGYLYYWSGNLLIPMFAHAVNNGFSVIVLYLYQQKKIDIDLENTKAAPWTVVIPFSVFTAGLLFFFYRFYKKNNLPPV